MVTAEIYAPSLIKRPRATKAEMVARREALFEIVAEQQPMSVRQVFYQATVRGIVEKAETGYDKVGRLLLLMRRAGVLPYQWISDNTRWMRKPTTFDSLEEALKHAASTYRRALWSNTNSYVEVWIEKDALAGVVIDVTSEYDVPLMVARGFSSETFLFSSAEYLATLNCPCFIYHFGDHDPSGVAAAEKIDQGLRRLAPHAEIYFQRVAVTPQQITRWRLPTRPTKLSDSRSKTWTGGDSVELDAIKPDDLRRLVRGVIEQHVDQEQLRILRIAEASERSLLRRWAAKFEEDDADD